jgi:hypothetical protein
MEASSMLAFTQEAINSLPLIKQEKNKELRMSPQIAFAGGLLIQARGFYHMPRDTRFGGPNREGPGLSNRPIHP